MVSIPAAERFSVSEQWHRRGQLCDAWTGTADQILEQDRFIDGAYPLYASHGQGAHLWDVDGNEYIDYMLGYGSTILGHAHADVTHAVTLELQNGTCVAPLWRPTQIALTELLTSVIPGAEMAFLMKTGSDASSAAVRLARIYTGRSLVVRWGYNGWHDWACPRDEGVPPEVRGTTLTFNYNDAQSLLATFEAHPDQIACVIMMPFMLEPPLAGFLDQVRSITQQSGALFILDEMRSGFRMALGGAQEYCGVRADLATFSKAMANGHPISAVVGRADVLSCLGRTHMVSTSSGNAAEMAAAIATIAILRDSDALEKVWSSGTQLQQGLRTLIAESGVPAEVLGYPPSPFLRFTYADDEMCQRAKSAFFTESTKGGVFFHPNHHWFISAAHSSDDISRTLEVCRGAFVAARRVE